MSAETAQIPKWSMKADYVETCNCDFGCPCNFSGFPTFGFCRAVTLYHITEGQYGSVNLAGLDVVFVASWPKAIHEGNGTTQLFVTNRASEEQRNAIVTIFSGQAKGDGPFAIFAPTFKYVLDPQYVEINVRIDGKRSTFSVPGVLDVQVENFKNPVTGMDQETKINLPQGFIWKVADCAKTRIMKITTPSLNFDDSGKNAFYSVVQHKGP
ncbi:MAG: DUF1326 domain-containing protein [Nitrososphaera sp.]